MFKVILSYVVSLRPAWVTVDSVSKSQTEPKQQQKSSMFLLVIRSKERWGVCVRGNLSWFYYQFKRITDI